MPSTRRNALLFALAAAVAAFLFFRATKDWPPNTPAPTDSFWGLVISSLIALWALFCALPTMDFSWRLKTGFVMTTFLAALVCLWPTIETMSSGKVTCPQFVRDRVSFAIAPGLDLRGGMRLVYTVEVEQAIRDKRDNFATDMRQELATAFGFHSGDGRVTREELQKLSGTGDQPGKVKVSTPESNLIRLIFTDKADLVKVDDRFKNRFTKEMGLTPGPGENEVTFKIRAEQESEIREKAVGQAKDTVNRRVDELGLREASVTVRDEDIIVEVPGQDEKAFNEIKDIIRRTARLEFKMVDDSGSKDIFGPAKLKANSEGLIVPEEGIVAIRANEPDGLDENGKKKAVEAHFVRIARRPNEAMNDTLKRLKKWTATLPVPDDHVIGYEMVVEPKEGTDPIQFEEVGWRTIYLFSRAEITGDYITDATTRVPEEAGKPYSVSLNFSPVGAERFEEITGMNVNRRFAIILDDVVDSAPVILTKIGGGQASITMGAGDSEQQLHNARKLELVLRSGALPAPISPSNESLIGPSLGKDAIDQGVKGALVGIALVLVFMAMYYRKSGVVADIAVLFNLLLQMAILASAGASMTLPGIAGLALTVGIAVDANVLINERIREELRAGRTVRAAVEAGYTKAFTAIIDGHVTVLITGIILWQYGSGPVKGFAVTLVVGIIASLFTGVFCTRLVFDWWARGAKVKTLSVGAEF